MSNLILSPKFRDFMTVYAEREYLEGTTAAGKTTVGIPKFMLRVAGSDKKDHVIAGADLGTVEKNIINSSLGLIAQFEDVAVYHSNGKGRIRLPHIEYRTFNGTKIIYVCGYDNASKWKKVLGSQMGCVFIDEVNIADMEFLREITHRCDYMMTTSNPDDPMLPIYKEFINKSRPLEKYVKDYPHELLEELCEPHVKGWIHWYFTFYDNASLSLEQIQKKIDAVPKGTKMYKNKIQGLRGRATGLVFSNFSRNVHTLSYIALKDYISENKLSFKKFTCGVDTSYSTKSEDTISFIYHGILSNGVTVVLDEEVYSNKDSANPLAPSDVPNKLIAFLERNRKEWGFAKDVYIDSADAATIQELKKYKSKHPCLYNFHGAWKKMRIHDRINIMLGWFKTNHYLVLGHCVNHIHELEVYSWQEKKDEPEDRNDHTINASQYAWIPYVNMIDPKHKEEKY